MFEQLDDLRPRMKATPRLIVLAAAYLVMLGIMVGILIGKRKWESWPWIHVTFWGLVLWRLLSPIYQQIASRMKDADGH